MPRVLEANDDALGEAAETLRAGGVVAFPTETVYGLGANTFDRGALRLVYEMKGRPAANPLIAHVHDEQIARERLAQTWDGRCRTLAARFWPGPLTLVVPKREDVPSEATAGLDTIAIRSPRHPAARRLLEAFAGPISAPSANRSGRVSPTTALHVADDFADVDDLIILDGGPCEAGIESTVLDLTTAPPRLLRPGAVTLEELRDALGAVDAPSIESQAASPGTSPRHYAPRTPARLVGADELVRAVDRVAGRVAVIGFADACEAIARRDGVAVIVMPEDPARYAADLYETLREADALDASAILIERPPESEGLWRSIHDRLRRATH